MDLKRVLLLINATAGVGSAKQKAFPIIEALSRRGCLVTAYPIIPKAGLTSETVLKASEVVGRYDIIACCGGDGTLNHVINGMISEGIDLPVGYIPSGSANDFSKNLNGDLSVEELCGVIAGGNTFSCDLGRLNGRYFDYVAGFGAFTDVSYSTNQQMKNLFGYGAYMMNLLANLPQNVAYKRHIVVEHDGIREEGEYVFGGLTNSLSIGGVKSPILNNASLNDGLFECVLIDAPTDLIEIHEIVHTLARGETDNPHVRTFAANKVRFLSEEPLSWTVDGEFGGSFTESEIVVEPERVRMLVAR